MQSQSSAASTPHKTNGTIQSGQGSTHSLQGSTHSAPPTFTPQSAVATPPEHSGEGQGSENVSEGEASTGVYTYIYTYTYIRMYICFLHALYIPRCLFRPGCEATCTII